MSLIKPITIIFWLFLLSSTNAIAANSNQYGSAYDSSLPLESISDVLKTEGLDGKMISLGGVMSAQCQGDACWFLIKDETGEILVDLKPYDFRTPLGLVGKRVKLNGRVNTKGKQVQIDATSVLISD